MTKPIPEGQEGLIPHLVCDPCAEAIDFYKKAFDAEEMMRLPTEDGGKLLHAALKIGGNVLMLMDDFPEFDPDGKSYSPKTLGGSSTTIHRYVEDCDAAFQKAVDAGATAKMAPADMFWGDRYCVVRDPFGHSWSFSTQIRELTPEEIAEAAAAQMPMSGCPQG